MGGAGTRASVGDYGLNGSRALVVPSVEAFSAGELVLASPSQGLEAGAYLLQSMSCPCPFAPAAGDYDPLLPSRELLAGPTEADELYARRGEGSAARVAYTNYVALGGDGAATGDGVIPVACAHLEGATQLTLDDVLHSINEAGTALPTERWYGSEAVIDRWLDAALAKAPSPSVHVLSSCGAHALLENWLCSVAAANASRLAHVVVWAADACSLGALAAGWPGVAALDATAWFAGGRGPASVCFRRDYEGDFSTTKFFYAGTTKEAS